MADLTNVIDAVSEVVETEVVTETNNEVCNLAEIVCDDDKPNKAGAIILGGLATVGAGTVVYGIYKGIKAGINWVKNKKAKAEDLDELEDDFFEEEVPVAEEVIEEATEETTEEEKPKKKAAPKK